MRKTTKKTARKATPIKKTTKRASRKKTVTLDDVVIAAKDAGAKVEVSILDNITPKAEDASPGYTESASQACAGTSEALRNDTCDAIGSYASAGFLQAVVANPVTEARKQLTMSVRALVEASVKMTTARNERISVRDVVQAEYHLAIARYELAVDGLERAIRG